MGLKYLSASPEPGSFDLLDKLVAEYGVAVGIHNHGPGDHFAKIETIEKAIKDHHPKIGCCVDTGHFLRSREDPVHAVEVFGKRVYGVHLKDVKDARTFTILGKGDLRTVDLLKALARNNYEYCLAIEYEENPENPVDDIKACLAEARQGHRRGDRRGETPGPGLLLRQRWRRGPGPSARLPSAPGRGSLHWGGLVGRIDGRGSESGWRPDKAGRRPRAPRATSRSRPPAA